MKRTIILLSTFALSSCTWGPPPEKPPLAAIINTKSQATVVNKMTEICDRNRLTIDETTQRSVTCSQEGNAFQQVLMKTRYGTPVQNKYKFTSFPLSGKTKVTATAWAETQNAFGQLNKIDMTKANGAQGLQAWLDTAKAEIEQK